MTDNGDFNALVIVGVVLFMYLLGSGSMFLAAVQHDKAAATQLHGEEIICDRVCSDETEPPTFGVVAHGVCFCTQGARIDLEVRNE